MSSSPLAPPAFYYNSTFTMNEYFSNNSYDNEGFFLPEFSHHTSYSNHVFTGCSVKDNMIVNIKGEGDLIPNDHLFDFYGTPYSTQPYDFMTASASSSCSPPPLLSPEFSNGFYTSPSTTSTGDNHYFYDTRIQEYPLIKPELTFTTTTSNYEAATQRHSSPESSCSVASHKKMFSCNYCSRSFARKYDVARHKRIHTGVKPYVCPCCSKGFSRSDARVRHFRTETLCRDGAERLGKQRRHLKSI
ncbi:hypothetical protein INT47_007689 [Mucor saturninus]|uniref:C2H2-type domain-containing protein n=1 Tax=Mucor saturninus TaxID=64648 RepID=A0A8H7QWI7_9FUNG|nr:hypothetical protein INT47_007689 [Mucor saturninus]